MPELTKQIRLRATDEEKSTLETAAADGGYANVSDYLRHFLFDQHVLIVLGAADDNGSLFRLIPAYSSVEAEQKAAIVNLEGLLALGAQLQAAVAAEGLAPTSPEPSFGPDSPEASPVAPAEEPAPAPAPAPAAPAPPPPVAAVPELEPEAATGGPLPGPDENFDAFMERRVAELVLTGLSQLRSSLEAEAEWRRAQDLDAAPALDAVPAPTDAPAAFCSQCGTALGGPFCSKCGTPAA